MLFDSASDRLLVLKVVPTLETGRRDLSAAGHAMLLISLASTNCQAPLMAMTVLNWNFTLNSRASQFRRFRWNLSAPRLLEILNTGKRPPVVARLSIHRHLSLSRSACSRAACFFAETDQEALAQIC